MAIKLHRCGDPVTRLNVHPCHKVQKALDKAGVDYEVVKHPSFPRGRRKKLQELTGQNRLPALELEDGTVVREESNDLVTRIEEGRLSAA
jgi:glutathione S-transferase